jgi:hypothetical protein
MRRQGLSACGELALPKPDEKTSRTAGRALQENFY